MILNSRPSHVAILVRSVQKAAEYLRPFGFLIGPEEVWEGEGTKEIYIEREKLSDQKLFVEPLSIQTELSASKLLQAIGLESMVATSTSPTELVLSGQRIMLQDLIA